MITAEQWVYNQLVSLNMPMALGANKPTVTVPYIGIYHALDDITHRLIDGQVIYHASVVHIEFISANASAGAALSASIKGLLSPPAIFLEEGQVIVAPSTTASGAEPPPQGDRRTLTYWINLAAINS